MNIQFIRGHIDLDKLENIDAIVCPTDAHFSGSGGLDKAIHHMAGSGLKVVLKGKHLSEGDVLVTKGFGLGTKQIIHAAIPKYSTSAAQADVLFHCYRKILIPHEDVIYPASDPGSIVITLLGTGSCGWSYEQSLDALWRAILAYQHNRGVSGCLNRLLIHYPGDISCSVLECYSERVSQAFFDRPPEWGPRLGLGFWYTLMDHFDDPKFNGISLRDFIQEIQRFFHKQTGMWLCGETNLFVPEWSHSCSGTINPLFAQLAVPILCSNLAKLGLHDQKSPSFLVPVTLRYGFTDYSLTLPYELLPELTHLRNPHSRMNAQMRIMLVIGQPYYLTTHHYHSAPSLVDFYSLDVETASDSHYHFSEEAAASICKQLGYAPNAIGAALSGYLKKHGGAALEALIKKYAREEFHYG